MRIKHLGIFGIVSLLSYTAIFERIGTFSVVIFNAVLGIFLMVGKIDERK